MVVVVGGVGIMQACVRKRVTGEYGRTGEKGGWKNMQGRAIDKAGKDAPY